MEAKIYYFRIDRKQYRFVKATEIFKEIRCATPESDNYLKWLQKIQNGLELYEDYYYVGKISEQNVYFTVDSIKKQLKSYPIPNKLSYLYNYTLQRLITKLNEEVIRCNKKVSKGVIEEFI